ncbi:hypothetical protein AB0C07_08375 [Actinoplanes missouriensis]|uniref:hypothetical protein n=1 Tax=Actinoplanes missouriensis TaxID=1866 RepID=UPI00340DB2C0
MGGDLQRRGTLLRSAAKLAAGGVMTAAFWRYEVDGPGWELGISIVVLMVGTGLVVDALRDLLERRSR